MKQKMRNQEAARAALIQQQVESIFGRILTQVMIYIIILLSSQINRKINNIRKYHLKENRLNLKFNKLIQMLILFLMAIYHFKESENLKIQKMYRLLQLEAMKSKFNLYNQRQKK